MSFRNNESKESPYLLVNKDEMAKPFIKELEASWQLHAKKLNSDEMAQFNVLKNQLIAAKDNVALHKIFMEIYLDVFVAEMKAKNSFLSKATKGALLTCLDKGVDKFMSAFTQTMFRAGGDKKEIHEVIVAPRFN